MAALSLAGMIYQFAFKNGATDSILKGIKKDMDKYPLAELANQVKTMWDVYVLDALHAHIDLASHKSPLSLTEKGLNMIPENIRELLKTDKGDTTQHSATWLVIKCLGMQTIDKLSVEMKLPVSIALALLTLLYKTYHIEASLSIKNGECNLSGPEKTSGIQYSPNRKLEDQVSDLEKKEFYSS
jgi:hypothetical protein